MKVNEWASLKRLKYDEDFSKKLEVGECFLSGRSMKAQQEGKRPGDRISYYKVLKIERKIVEYTTIFDVLEKD